MNYQQQLFDLSLLEQMSDKNFIKQVIDMYLQDTRVDISEMKTAFSTGDLETVFKKAHKLKSSTGMLKADILYNLLAEIETSARTGTGNGQLTGMVEQVDSAFQSLQSALVLHLQGSEMVA